jgi:hypothetical protein
VKGTIMTEEYIEERKREAMKRPSFRHFLEMTEMPMPIELQAQIAQEIRENRAKPLGSLV